MVGRELHHRTCVLDDEVCNSWHTVLSIMTVLYYVIGIHATILSAFFRRRCADLVNSLSDAVSNKTKAQPDSCKPQLPYGHPESFRHLKGAACRRRSLSRIKQKGSTCGNSCNWLFGRREPCRSARCSAYTSIASFCGSTNRWGRTRMLPACGPECCHCGARFFLFRDRADINATGTRSK